MSALGSVDAAIFDQAIPVGIYCLSIAAVIGALSVGTSQIVLAVVNAALFFSEVNSGSVGVGLYKEILIAFGRSRQTLSCLTQ